MVYALFHRMRVPNTLRISPRNTSCMPPKKRIAAIVDAYPDISTPKINVFNMIYIPYTKATDENIKPSIAAQRRGEVVNDVIPSIERFTSLL